jgi:uncharacterized protein (DUF2237 family)
MLEFAMSFEQPKNVLGTPLESCSCSPMTGYFRDGFCRTDQTDFGLHIICAIMTKPFLAFTKAQGNDLSTPNPMFDFPGLKPGDHWCLCATRWMEALNAGCAPPVILESCHEKTLELIPLEELKIFSFATAEEEQSRQK